MLLYLLKVSCCWLGFYGLYYCWLSKETFFQLNRYYLLGTLAAGLIIPLLTLPFSIEWFGHTEPQLTPIIEIGSLGPGPEAVVLPDLPPASRVDWRVWLQGVYWLGVAVAFVRFATGMIQLFRVYIRGTKVRKPGYALVLTREDHLPFSFGKTIFRSQSSSFSAEEEEKILIHELAHVRGLHSLDILLVEILGIFFWFNPLIYLYRRSIKVTHEYIADAAVTSVGQRKQYGHLLLRQSLSGPSVALANHFIHSQLKKRINMMMQLPSPAKARLKYLLALPIFISALGLFAQSGEKIAPPPVSSPLDQLEQVVVVGYPINDDKPLYVIDNRLSNEDKLKEIDPSAIESVHVLKGAEATKQFGDAGKNGVIIINTKENAGYEGPRFPGCEELDKHVALKNACGEKHLFMFISSTMKFPAAAKEAGIEGTAIASFTITETGKVRDAKVVQSVSPEIDREVLRVIGEMPEWIPAHKGGKAISTDFTLPFSFKLPHTGTNGAEEIFKVVEEMPHFPGCEEMAGSNAEKKQCADKKMLEYIYTNIKYPAEARKQSITGVVVAGFVIEKDGTLSNFEVKRGIGGGCDEEVIRILKQMNEDGIRWIPGVQRGRKVRVQFNLPVKFMLEGRTEAPADLKPVPAAGEELFKVVEEMPRFPGDCEDMDASGLEKKKCADKHMLEYIYSNIKYPALAHENGIEGTVVIGFVVEKDGTLSNFKMLRGIGGGCEEEALRVVKLMNEQGLRWTPGLQRGQQVRVQFNLPIRFMLEKESKPAEQPATPDLKAAKAAPTLELEGFSASPNPTSGKLEVRFQGPAQDTRLVAYDASGRIVYQSQWRNFDGNFNETIDLSDAPSGTFTLAVIQQDKIYTHQFVKQ